MEDVKNAVVKLEEINWDEYHLQSTAESPSTADALSHPEIQNDVKLEELVDWDENPSQQNDENPSTVDDAPSDAEIQNNEVKLEEVADWDENNSTLSS